MNRTCTTPIANSSIVTVTASSGMTVKLPNSNTAYTFYNTIGGGALYKTAVDTRLELDMLRLLDKLDFMRIAFVLDKSNYILDAFSGNDEPDFYYEVHFTE